jgi:WS/DGAT/MGAT family acyltransferase
MSSETCICSRSQTGVGGATATTRWLSALVLEACGLLADIMASAIGTPLWPGRPVIERASAADRAFLAMDSAYGPEQFGVILGLENGGQLGLAQLRRLLAERVPAVPRLRQRLIGPSVGCGGPLWVDDPGFDIGNHVRTVSCAEPGDERALLETALSVITTPLSRSAPLWSAVLVTGLAGGAAALVLVLHHALADGVGGLAVLAGLVDAPACSPGPCFPLPAPARAALARDAWAARLRALRHVARSWRLLRLAMGAAGGLRPVRAAACSLNQRTGSRQRLTVLRADLAAVRAASHRCGATVDDAVLVAVAGALGRVLRARGESADTIVLAVPVSGRPRADTRGLGNMVSPMLVSVPTTGAVPDRLRRVAAQVRAGKSAATGPPPIAVLGWLFRPLAALGGFRWYMNHQHRFHTLVSHVRGPAERVMFGGAPITRATAVGVGPGGNVPAHFEVLSYADTLTLSVISDPDRFPDPDELTGDLRDELALIIRHGVAP